MPIRAAIIAMLLWCWPFPALADTLAHQDGNRVVNAALDKVALLPWARIVKDPDNKATVGKILALPATGKAPGSEMVSFGFGDASYWFSLSLDNPASVPLQRLLLVEPPWLDDIQVTLILPDGTRQVFKGGDRMPFDHRAIPHRNSNFELTLPPGQSRLLVRTQTQDPFLVAMTLWEKSAFYASDRGEAQYYGLIYGALGALLIFNLILFFSVRDSIYAAYVAYLFSFLAGHAAYTGHLYLLLWPAFPAWANWAHSIFIYLFVLAGLMFAVHFLELRARLLPAYRWARWLTLAILASFVATAFGGYGLHIRSSILWIVAYTPFVLLFGVWSLSKGNRAARYFLTATTAGFVGAFITASTVSGLIPYSLYGYRAIDIGMLFDASLLSLALADRLRISRMEAEQARTKLIEATRSYAQLLEDEVAERTLELRNTNAIKDKFFSIIAHDLRGPIYGLAMYFKIIKSAEHFTDEGLKTVRATIENTRDFLEELLTWARTQRGEIDRHPVAFDVGEVAREIQELFSAKAHAKGIQLDLDIGTAWIFADLAMTRTILRNLTDNALKFTQRGGSVRASLSRQLDRYLVSITDTGVGMNQELLDNVFRLNAKTRVSPGGESGTGLGLILCKEFAEKNDGAIGVQSEPGKGSSFWFSLPAAEAPEMLSPQAVRQRIGALKVLIAEDDQLQREASAQILRDFGCSPVFAADGAAAIRLASDGDFDLILMDIDMPQVDGIEAARRIRAGGSRARIISLSAYSRQELDQLAGGVRFDEYLFKPLTKDALTMVAASFFPACAQTWAVGNAEACVLRD